MSMTAKQMASQVLQQLPDDCSLEDIMYRLYVRDRILKGLDSARQEGTLTHEEVESRLSRWTGA